MNSIAAKIIATYRGWDAFERKHGGSAIIDFDLVPQKSVSPFNSRKQVLDTLEYLLTEIGDTTHEEEFLRDRIRASVLYLRTLMGQQIPFNDYLQQTLGIHLEPFLETEIAAIRSKVEELLAHFGLRFVHNCNEEFDRRFIIHKPERIKQGILQQRDFWLGRLRERGVPIPPRIPIRVEFAEVDAYWSNWISGSFDHGFLLRINLSSRRKYDLGRPLFLCLHEICGHAAQMAVWQQGIMNGEIDPACGVTTVHSPEAFVSEGLGQTVSDFLGAEEDFPIEFRLSRYYHYYYLAILHNAHLMLYSGTPVDEVVSYSQENLPFSDLGTIKAELRDRANNPLYRTYQLTYAAGEYLIRKLTRDMNSEQKRQFAIALYTIPMTPTHMQKIARAVPAKRVF